MARHAIAVIGADRPGIVAAVTEVLVSQGCNIEDSSMALLRGNFAMMLVVDGPPDPAELELALAPVRERLDLIAVVRPVPVDVTSNAPRRPYVVAVYGADHSGIVHGIAKLLADRRVNITDVVTRLVEGESGSVYSMQLEVDLPDDLSPDDLRGALTATAERLGVRASLHADDPDVL